MSLKSWITDYASRWANDPPISNISYVYNSIFGDSGSYGTGSSIDYDSFKKSLSQLLSTMNATNSTSAYEAALAAARETNSFNARQAEINRQFQQASAQKAMDFEALQAEINRQFQQSSADKSMAFERDQAELNRQFQQASVDKAMAFEKEMASTVYQRAIEDMKKAGLNPLLAYQNLQTTSASGSSASGSSASGRSASGSSASGRSASGSSASGVKADVSSALAVERQSLDRLLNILTLNVSSAYKLVDAIVPGVNIHN